MKNKVALIFSASLFVASNATAGTNVAIAEFVNSIRGSFNMVVANKHVVSAKRLKKTNKMIEKGYRSEVLNMQILLEDTGLDANIRMFSERRYPDFTPQEMSSKKYLLDMTETLSKEAKRRLEGSDFDTAATGSDEAIAAEDDLDISDDIGTEIDFDDTLLEVSDDTISDGSGSFISLEQIAQDTFLSIGQEYIYTKQFRGKEVLWYSGGDEQKIKLGTGTPNLKQVFIPYHHEGVLKPMPLHSVFATTFMPDRNGVLYVMEMYIILVVNEAEHGTTRVAQRKIDKFRWDRNPYYISAATGTVLKKIFTNTLGRKVEKF